MLAPSRDDLRAEQQGGVSLWYIATRAGVSDRSANWLLNYVRLLIANERLPQAAPLFRAQRQAAPGHHLHSRWIRTAVDAWFDGFLPPHLVAVANDRNAERDAVKLDQRAGISKAEAAAIAAAADAAPRPGMILTTDGTPVGGRVGGATGASGSGTNLTTSTYVVSGAGAPQSASDRV
jgi:hypothetical protein